MVYHSFLIVCLNKRLNVYTCTSSSSSSSVDLRPLKCQHRLNNLRITMFESVIPAVLLRALSEYKFVGSPERMANRKDHVRVVLSFNETLPTGQSTRRGLKAGGSMHPLLASDLASPQLLDVHHHRRPYRRLQHADSRQRRRRRQYRQQYRRYRSTHQILSQYQDHRRQHRSRHHQSSRNQLHRLLLQSRHRRRSPEQCLRRRTLHLHSTLMSTSRKNTLYMKSTSSRMSRQRNTRPSLKLQDYRETMKKSTLIYQSTLSTTETTSILWILDSPHRAYIVDTY